METVLIASFLEPDLVARIDAAWPGDVIYRPDLIPTPSYVSDHGGEPPALDAAGEREWLGLLGRAQISFDFDWWQPAAMPDHCPELAWVQATSAGIGGFVRRYGLEREDLVLTTAAGTHAAPLAEFALLGALFCLKRVPDLLSWQREHRWQRYTTDSLAGRRVTVVGLGEIGRRTAASFAALGARVTGVARAGGSTPELTDVRVVDTDALDDVLPSSDVLVLCVPLTPETEGLIDARRVGLLPPGAVVVNVARGPVLDHPALIEALRAGRLGGAALDVTDPEPLPPDSPLWDLPNVLISPHSASTLATENAVIVDLFLDNLDRWRAGRPLRNRYRPELGY